MPHRSPRQPTRSGDAHGFADGDESPVRNLVANRQRQRVNTRATLFSSSSDQIVAGPPMPAGTNGRKRSREEESSNASSSAKRLQLADYGANDDEGDRPSDARGGGGGGYEEDNNEDPIDFGEINQNIAASISPNLSRTGEIWDAVKDKMPKMPPSTRLAQARDQAANVPQPKKRGRPKGKKNKAPVLQRTAGEALLPQLNDAAESVQGGQGEAESAVPVSSSRTYKKPSLQRPKAPFRERATQRVGDAYSLQSSSPASADPKTVQKPSSNRGVGRGEDAASEHGEPEEEIEAHPTATTEERLKTTEIRWQSDEDPPVWLIEDDVVYLYDSQRDSEDEIREETENMGKRDLSRQLWQLANYVLKRFESCPYVRDLNVQTAHLRNKQHEIEKAFTQIDGIVSGICERIRTQTAGRKARRPSLLKYQIPTMILLLKWTFDLGRPKYSKTGKGRFTSTTLGLLSRVAGWVDDLENTLPENLAEHRQGFRATLTKLCESIQSALAGLDFARRRRQEEEVQRQKQAAREKEERAARIAKNPEIEAAQAKKDQEGREKFWDQWLAMCRSTHQLRERPAPLQEAWKRTLAAQVKSGGRTMSPWKDQEAYREHEKGVNLSGTKANHDSLLVEYHDDNIFQEEDVVEPRSHGNNGFNGAQDSPLPHPWTNEECNILISELKSERHPDISRIARLLDRDQRDVEQQAELFRQAARVMAQEGGYNKVPLWANS